jgi:hypothetical protein
MPEHDSHREVSADEGARSMRKVNGLESLETRPGGREAVGVTARGE